MILMSASFYSPPDVILVMIMLVSLDDHVAKNATVFIISLGEKLITDNDFCYPCTPKWDIIG